ncbi:YncE family protein [Bacteroidota bacterium]
MTNFQTIIITLIILIPISTFSQEFNNPESVVFDSETNSYFVSNNGNGTILQIDTSKKTTIFKEGLSGLLGIKIFKDIVYVAEDVKSGDDVIHGFDKFSGEEVFVKSIPNSKQLNDIEIDNKGNLYVSDRKDHKIYKINLKKKNYEVFVDSLIKTPNGLYFEKKSKRLFVCNTIDKSEIFEVNIKTGKTILICKTYYSHFDGITIGSNGFIYVTSWSEDWKESKLLKYDGKTFTEILSNKNGMADIYFNKKKNCIEIANFYKNTISSFKLLQ